MRSDKFNKRNHASEDFLAEFRNMENSSYNDIETEAGRTSRSKKSKKQLKKEAKLSKKNGKKFGKNGKKKRMWPKVLIVLILLFAALFAAVYVFADNQLKKMDYTDTSKIDLGIDKTVNKRLSGYTNIALLGIDARKGEDPTKCRTDAIIVCTIDNKTGSITLTSVARDINLLMTGPDGVTEFLDKATHAHAFGGPVNTVRMLNRSLDLNIDKYAVFDWNAIADMVDAVGGITVDVKENEIPDMNKYIPETAENTGRTSELIQSAGEQKLDGAQAATYCRIRKTSGGDTGRTTRMKIVATGVFKAIRKNPATITKLTSDVFPQVRTNMTTSDFLPLVPKVVSMNIDKSISFPYNYWGGIINGKWLAIPTTLDENAIRLHQEMFPNEKNYEPSETLMAINNQIINETGITEGYEAS